MAGVRFCPFCRESYEDTDICPEHGLVLVDFLSLPRELDAEPGDAWLGLGISHQRGWIVLGVLLMLLAFDLPMASLSGQVSASNTLWELANARSKTLWLIPMVCTALLVTLHRRRTPDQLRSVRVVVMLLAVVPAVVVGLTAGGIIEATQLMSAKMGGVEVHFGWGAWLTCAAVLPLLWGGLRLGLPRKRAYRVDVAPD